MGNPNTSVSASGMELRSIPFLHQPSLQLGSRSLKSKPNFRNFKRILQKIYQLTTEDTESTFNVNMYVLFTVTNITCKH